MGFNIYAVSRGNAVVYVGQTVNSVEQRWRQHCSYNLKAVSLLNRAIRKHGPESFSITTVSVATDQACADLEERRLIALHQPRYNVMPGGWGNAGRVVTEITRERLRVAMAGRIITQSARDKTSATLKKRYAEDPEFRGRAVRHILSVLKHVDQNKRKRAAAIACKLTWAKRGEEIAGKISATRLARQIRPSKEHLEKLRKVLSRRRVCLCRIRKRVQFAVGGWKIFPL